MERRLFRIFVAVLACHCVLPIVNGQLPADRYFIAYNVTTKRLTRIFPDGTTYEVGNPLQYSLVFAAWNHAEQVLYGTNGTILYTVDLETGFQVPIGIIGSAQTLTVSAPTGFVYTSVFSNPCKILLIHPTTGEITDTGHTVCGPLTFAENIAGMQSGLFVLYDAPGTGGMSLQFIQYPGTSQPVGVAGWPATALKFVSFDDAQKLLLMWANPLGASSVTVYQVDPLALTPQPSFTIPLAGGSGPFPLEFIDRRTAFNSCAGPMDTNFDGFIDLVDYSFFQNCFDSPE